MHDTKYVSRGRPCTSKDRKNEFDLPRASPRSPKSDRLLEEVINIAERHDLLVVEDAAQGILPTYKGRPLGAIGHIGTLSFHETRNIISGEGGAVLLNGTRRSKRAEIIREKGTNRKAFFRGEVDK